MKSKNPIPALWAVLAVLMITSASAASAILGDRAGIATVVMAALILMYLVLEAYRRLDKKAGRIELSQSHHYRQLEALSTLLFTLRPRLPFPPMRGWAASPDLLQKIAGLVLERHPRLVVEASSGVSTLVIAYCLQQLGEGKVIALEHDEKYAAITRNLIAAHGLHDIATVLHAPLREYQLNGSTWSWYDLSGLTHDDDINMVVVDGPPEYLNKLARYPALPLLRNRLSDNVVIVLDDGARLGEKHIVERWQQEFPGVSSEFIDLEKGAFEIHLSAA